ncbi:hypothetical protein AY599_25035 [Leptolyngbya valderiana BDU 20041]|uniref:hypothetical protein n=1 Tax=Baaleninema simplex TaxID=2862350 RepID=UPI0003448DAC|nr:hypothetical protein [Baaleninema simplex]MDC0832434.1 hypothetical protein [Geitlerinema sp. CS-897]OAB63080.1 hypothetical protein AY599_25035 [Leptolyngbya valderiana BDU 20041]PPT07506.1 hypothetical protein CKA32_004664 [Geitlerinema sp. FC II]
MFFASIGDSGSEVRSDLGFGIFANALTEKGALAPSACWVDASAVLASEQLGFFILTGNVSSWQSGNCR